MSSEEDLVELLFFDTFSHETLEDINLDLVQFPQPVFITEVRIIPLGARVQADFPGGVRLGATNPSKFGIEFFVNDLGKPGASTFEKLGRLDYNQNDCINFVCDKIPTDGLVLRGWYSTITLAVYGTLTASVSDPIESPPINELVEEPELVPNVSPTKKQEPPEAEREEAVVVDHIPPRKSSCSPNRSHDYKWTRSPEYRHHHHSLRSRPQSPDDSDNGRSPPKSRKHRADEDEIETIEDEEQDQLEQISDDDIIGDETEDNYPPDGGEEEPEEVEIEGELETAIAIFDPYKMPLGKYHINYDEILLKDIEEFHLIARKFEKQTKIATSKDFIGSLAVEKENFVILSDQLLTHFCHLTFSNRFFDVILRDHPENQSLLLNILNVSLDYECAKSQPQALHNIRHIKIGVRLAETLGGFEFVLNREDVNLFHRLFALYNEDYMALSIKLMIIKAISCILDVERALRIFTGQEMSGYRRIIELMDKEEKVAARTKFALKAIIKKINFFDTLETLKRYVNEQFIREQSTVDHSQQIESCIREITSILTVESSSCQQFKRLLPVVRFAQSNDPGAKKSFSNMIQNYFKTNSLGECLLLILTNITVDAKPTLLVAIHNLIEILLRMQTGIDYLVDDCFETTQLLVNCLLEEQSGGSGGDESTTTDDPTADPKSEESEDFKEIDTENTQSSLESKSLGLQLAFKVQTRYHIDAITYEKNNLDVLVEHLHSLYSQTCSHPGRDYTVEVLGLERSLTPFLDLVEKERKTQAQRQQDSPGAKYKSPVLSYSVDIVDCCVRHCEDLTYIHQYGKIILDLAKNHEVFEPSVSAVLQEMFVYLKPFEIIDIGNADDIGPLVELIKRSMEVIATFPGELVMGLRILRHLCLNPSSTEVELKYRYRLLQFFSLDGVVTLVNIIDSLNNYFEQPGLHSPTFMSMQGLYCCQIAIPALEILKGMHTYVIQCRDAEFKDVTSIEHLMRMYYLMYYFPEQSLAYDRARQAKTIIVKILLTFTQPTEKHEEESLMRSLWTQMIREVFKSILSGGLWKYVPGLQLLAELLPLPLPLPTHAALTKDEQQRLLMERKLWSGHLHPESGLISQIIKSICPTSFPQLLDFLCRVCLQLANLAPNMSLLISKTIVDLIIAEPLTNSVHLARLFNFLEQLTAYASIKISALSIFTGKLYEMFCSILAATNEPSDSMIRCQVSVHRILEHFFDSEISIVSSSGDASDAEKSLNLACALPPKELVCGIIEAVYKNLIESEIKNQVTLAASRNLIIFTEHDITFYYLKKTLLIRKEEYQGWLTKVLELHQSGEYTEILKTVVLFFRDLLFIEPLSVYSIVPNRTLKMSIGDLALLIGVNKDTENGNPHMVKKMKNILEDSEEGKNKEALMLDISDLNEKIDAYLQNPDPNNELDSLADAPYMPQAESIVTQYSKRPITIPLEAFEESQLKIGYWVEPLSLGNLTDTIATQIEKVPCDLSEIISASLPSETNLASDCKRILHLSASPQSQRERSAAQQCFRKRRVDLDPTPVSRPDKKMFIPNMNRRGFARAPPSRGDLFRSRPPNTSRPPSLHVDDFLALETHGVAPTCPTGYNKIPPIIRGGGRGRGRGSRISNSGFRTNSPNYAPPTHFRTATSEPVNHFGGDPLYSGSYYGVRSRGRGRVRSYV